MPRRILLVATLLVTGLASSALAQVTVDDKLPEYEPIALGVSGTLKSVGSDTMNNLMAYWAEGFREFHPAVRIEIEGKGSSTAPPALIAGSAQFGPMSRDMKDAEIAAFKRAYGYEPTALRAAIDALGVFVHKDNPIDSLTLPELDGIYSRTGRLGHEPVATWGELGLEGRLSRMPISLYGRNAASGTYGFFKEAALGNGDFRPNVKEQPGSSAVVQGVGGDIAAIGYSGIGYKTSGVKALAIARNERSPAYAPTSENVYRQHYPLFRFLKIYVNVKPGDRLDPLRREFIRYIFSKDGQLAVVKDGYFSVPAALAERELAKIGISLFPESEPQSDEVSERG